MPTIDYAPAAGWHNYHLTVATDIAELGHYSGVDETIATGPQRFHATKAPLHALIARAATRQVPAGITGTAWSFAPLIGWENIQVDLTGLSGCSLAVPEDLHSACKIPADDLAFVSGGTTLRQLVNWAKTLASPRSIRTSGTHLGPTIAGAMGTASHGSRLGFGGIQDQVVGIHLVTSANSSVWIERADQHVLNDSTAARFATVIIRDDAIFEDVLVHLGGMGIVNGVAFRLDPYRKYRILRVDHPVDAEWLAHVRDGDFGMIASRLGDDGTPVFYEATLNPADPFGPQALHTMYFEMEPEVPAAAMLESRDAPLRGVADFVAALTNGTEQLEDADPPAPPFTNLLALYASPTHFQYTLPAGARSAGMGWEELHPTDTETGGYAGGLYNASYAFDRRTFDKVLPVMCSAVAGIKPTFVFTVRFVTDPGGTLAFTRFKQNAVIELDGVSPNAPLPYSPLGQFTEQAAVAIRAGLDAHRIDYGMHWAKLGGLDADKIAVDFGPAPGRPSKIERWRQTRLKLLGEEGAKLFRNKALADYGLI